jgi:hypothetical protein
MVSGAEASVCPERLRLQTITFASKGGFGADSCIGGQGITWISGFRISH